MQSGFSKRLITSLALISLASADYFIDDQNYTSLIYSENPGGAKWGPFQEGGEILSITLVNGTVMNVDASHCFNYTYTYAACTLADECEVQIPFSGSGITIYVLQAGPQGINASLTIDGGVPTYNVLSAPSGPNFYVSNVTLFSVHGMVTGNHTATMTVQNWENIFSGMMFDYAWINQTIVTESTTTTHSVASSTAASATSTTTSTNTPSPSSSATNVGAIVGGVLGGLGALIALTLAIFYLRRRHREHPESDVDVDVNTEYSIQMMEPFLSPEPSSYLAPDQYTSTTEHLASGSVATDSVNALLLPPRSTSSHSSRHEKSQLGVADPGMGQVAGSRVTSSVQTGASSTYPPSETSRPRIQQTHPTLTDDQADFVNNLYTNNVPAAAIARVIERMMAGERQPPVDGYDSLPPPSYYHSTGDE